MGFFSWVTSDTYKSISNAYSLRGALPVYLVTPNDEYIFENEYEGYGVFGGYDAYALLAHWNAPELCTGYVRHDRSIGIGLTYKDARRNPELMDIPVKYPLKFAESNEYSYAELDASLECRDQGYFYDDEEDAFEEEYCDYCGYLESECECDC